MKILLINHYAGSIRMGMEFRPFLLAKAWKELGVDTTIVAGSYSHVRQVQPESLGFHKEEGIDYLWLWNNKYQGNGFVRLLSMLVFVLQLLLMSPYFIFKIRPDCVIASSTYPIDIFPAYLISRLSGAKLVFEIHDLWPLSPMEMGGMSKFHPFVMLMRFGEWFAFKFADKVVSILPFTYEHVVKDGVKRSDFTVVPNGIDLKGYKRSKPVPESISKIINAKRKKGYKLIGYAGGLGPSNSMHTIFSAAKLLRDEKVFFIIVGKGSLAHEMTNNSSNVIIHDAIPKECVLNFLKQMDFLWLGMRNLPLYKFGFSLNKEIDYMMSETPIIQSMPFETNNVCISKCGTTVPAENPVALANAIKKALDADYKTLKLAAKKGKKYITANLEYSRIAKKFLDFIR